MKLLATNDFYVAVEAAPPYLSRRSGLVDDLSFTLNEDLTAVCRWATQNDLDLNQAKSIVLPISQTFLDYGSIPRLFIKDSQLRFVNKTICLRFYLNSSLYSH